MPMNFKTTAKTKENQGDTNGDRLCGGTEATGSNGPIVPVNNGYLRFKEAPQHCDKWAIP